MVYIILSFYHHFQAGMQDFRNFSFFSKTKLLNGFYQIFIELNDQNISKMKEELMKLI